jgi:glutamine synthetase
MPQRDAPELVQILTTDLVAITRGRSLAVDTAAWREQGCGWVPANLALDPFGAIATPNVWGASGDLRLRPDMATEVRVDGIPGRPPLHFVLADITELDGMSWACCPRGFLRRALADLHAAGLALIASFEHEFTLLDPATIPAPCFSLAAHRRAEPFLTDLFAALRRAGAEPEMILPEYGPNQVEVTLAPADALAAADRAVILREVTREVASAVGHNASFCPKTRPDGVGNGVHIHFGLRSAAGAPATYDPARRGALSAVAGAFVGGIVRHIQALCAITAPSPVSYLRLVPQHWSAAYACLGKQNREAAVRICPVPATATDPARSFNLEYRAADATANPYLALGVLVRAGLAGLRADVPLPPLVNRDPADMTEPERIKVNADRLPDSLSAALSRLAADAEVTSWFPSELLSTFRAVKQQEISQAAGIAPDELCRRYRAIY